MKANQNKQKQGLTEINLTSLVDVSLTLVIIFMVSSPFIIQSHIKISTPTAAVKPQPSKKPDVRAEVHLKAGGSLLLNGRPVQITTFSDSLRTLLAASSRREVLISADGDVVHDQVIAIMDEAKQCGAAQLSLLKRR